jgi:hypothetical protein
VLTPVSGAAGGAVVVEVVAVVGDVSGAAVAAAGAGVGFGVDWDVGAGAGLVVVGVAGTVGTLGVVALSARAMTCLWGRGPTWPAGGPAVIAREAAALAPMIATALIAPAPAAAPPPPAGTNRRTRAIASWIPEAARCVTIA